MYALVHGLDGGLSNAIAGKRNYWNWELPYQSTVTYILDGHRHVLNPVSVGSLSERGIHPWIRWVPVPEKKA
jgi:hypothetical protein